MLKMYGGARPHKKALPSRAAENFRIFADRQNFLKFFFDEIFEISAHPENFTTPHGPPRPRLKILQRFFKFLRAR